MSKPPLSTEQMQARTRWLGRLLWITGPLSLLGLLWSTHASWEANEATGWTQVEAQVVASNAVGDCTYRCRFNIDLTYRYSYQGVGHESSHVFFGRQLTYSRPVAQSLLKGPGALVTAYVNPANPSRSALVVGETGAATWSLTLVLLYVHLMLWAVRRVFASIVRYRWLDRTRFPDSPSAGES